MRHCRDLLEAAVAQADVPRWQFALIDDRIRVYEGRPQRYGTQLRGGPNGLEPYPLEDKESVEEWRKGLGLPTLEEILSQARANAPPPSRNQSAKDEAEVKWRREVGWLS